MSKKLAEEWAEKELQRYLIEEIREEWKESLLNYITYGVPYKGFEHLPIQDRDYITITEKLDIPTIMERYNLTEEEINQKLKQ